MSPVGDAHQLNQVFPSNDAQVLMIHRRSQNGGTEGGGYSVEMGKSGCPDS